MQLKHISARNRLSTGATFTDLLFCRHVFRRHQILIADLKSSIAITAELVLAKLFCIQQEARCFVMNQRRTKIPRELENFDYLPDSANVRLSTVMGLFGISAATVWRNAGKTIPSPYKLSARVTCWNVGELRQALAKNMGVKNAQ